MIKSVDAPTLRRTGRRPRLSDEDLKALADCVNNGEWGTDDEPVPTRGAAYQRAHAAVELLSERHDLDVARISSSTFQVDPSDEKSPWKWMVGPLPEGRKSRRKASSTESSAESSAE